LQYQHSLGVYIAEKHIYCATILSQTLLVYSVSSFVKPLLPSEIAKSREIPDKIWSYRGSGSSTFLSIESTCATSY